MCAVKFRKNFVTFHRDMMLMPESRHNESGVRSQVMDEKKDEARPLVGVSAM